MSNRTYSHPTWLLVFLAVVSLVTYYGASTFTLPIKQDFQEEKKMAAECMVDSTALIRRRLLAKDPKALESVRDPNRTGLVGPSQTAITTDTGVLKSKLTATNPNYAALVVQLLRDAGVRGRDLVAASMTGSMPGLNVATWCAFEALDVEALVVSSVGSSNYGATWTDMTWPDMEKVLYDTGAIKRHSVAVTPGGQQDRGSGLTNRGKMLIEAAILRSGLKRLHFTNVQAGIQARMDIYDALAAERPIRAYVNVGGSVASLGSQANRTLILPGLNKKLDSKRANPKGVAFLMSDRNIPVIQLLDTVDLGQMYGLPAAPVPLPPVGSGGVFAKSLPQQNVIAVALGFLLILVVICGRLDIFTKIFFPKLSREGKILGEKLGVQKGVGSGKGKGGDDGEMMI